MNITVNDLSHHFDAGTLSRGAAYARQGNVLNLQGDDSHLLSAVGGSGGAVYQQTIRIKTTTRGLTISGQCSCPMSRNCKHVVAALLHLIAVEEAAVVDEDAAHTNSWLDEWQQALASTVPPAIPLVFVLSPERGDTGVRLDVCKVKLARHGGITALTIIDDLELLLNGDLGPVDPDDQDAVRLVAALRADDPYATHTSPSGRLGASLLDSLANCGQLYWHPTGDIEQRNTAGQMVRVQPGPPRPAQLAWSAASASSDTSMLGWYFDDGSAIGEVLPTEPLVYLDRQLLGPLTLPPALAALDPPVLQRLVAQAPRPTPDKMAALAERMHQQGLTRLLPLPQTRARRTRSDIAPVPHLLLDHLLLDHLVVGASSPARDWQDHARLWFDYDGMRAEGEGSELQRHSGEGIDIIERQHKAERAARQVLSRLGFSAATAPLADALPHALQLSTASAWLRFVRLGVPKLRKAGWQIVLGEHYRYDLHEVDELTATVNGKEIDEDTDQDDGEEDPANDWFSLKLGIIVDGQHYALLPLLIQIMRAAPNDFNVAAIAARAAGDDLLLTLPDERRVVLPWVRVKPILLMLFEMHFSEDDGDGWRLPVTDAARLAELEQAAQLRWIGGDRLRALGRKLQQFDGIPTAPLPAGLRAQLRPYQHAGLSWMQFLREYGFAGILADDMGLGKTVQTLAHILAEQEAGRLDRPALVVAPTSLMDNWQSEAARFAPSLRVLLLHGKDRADQFDRMGEADLVLTTYPLLARDETVLRAQPFHLLILDEAQTIKNSRAKATQTACLLDARHRLCLTGTPVQNHLGELWSQFHFLMPGLLGSEKAFNRLIRKPIEQHGDAAVNARLNRRIKPFLLRRTKDKVATELPPKTEMVHHVDFGAAQRDLYETVRVAMDRKVRDEIDRRGLARSQIVILDALLKLRQVCCDPRLLKKQASSAGSAKLDALMTLLETLRSEGRKVLVFSQFTSMLALIGEQLRERAIDFALLTGDTVERGAEVARFQGGEVNVFLISLKAGGVGLNLTAADTVIHYDPWWNPASENQATDRAWRIGQTQPVFVYKLIARGTLEEKIQQLQLKKGALASAVLDGDAALAQGLAAADLQAILAPLDGA